MQCPRCGAEAKGKFCEYCGSQMPRIAPETINHNNSHTTIINNYYNMDGEEERPVSVPRQQPAYNPPEYHPPVSAAPEPAALAVSPKSKYTAFFLCLFLGSLGVHHFYAGKVSMGVLYLLTIGLFGIGWFVDIILILAGVYKDSNGLPLKK